MARGIGQKASANVIDLEVTPASEAQTYFLNSLKRNILFNSGFGAGKTFIACYKLLLLLAKFPKSRAVIGRQVYRDLAKTTMQTFFQVCPYGLYDLSKGGAWNKQDGYLRLINGSEIFFMHFDDLDVSSIKSLEINFLLLDQAEEILEAIYLALDSRLGRKSDAIVPPDLLEDFPDWPRNAHTGRPEVPVYAFLLINPPDEGELHYLIQRFHPDSEEWKERYQEVNDYIVSSSRDNAALSKENLENMLSRDPKWVARYVDAKISQGEGAIHQVHEDSIVEPNLEFIANIRRKGALSRVLDHGQSSPTCCLWFSSFKGFHYCFQEYYVPDALISEHRQNIHDLSLITTPNGMQYEENYIFNLADPSIFDKTAQKKGGFWSVADEYMDSGLDGPALAWVPADNNEFATRNRINELLKFDPNLVNPITGRLGSPRLFFFKRTREYPNGCYHAIRELKAQKKMLIGTMNGKNLYSDKRDETVVDHAYDPTRYYCASHLQGRREMVKKPSQNSFYGIRARLKAMKESRSSNAYQG